MECTRADGHTGVLRETSVLGRRLAGRGRSKAWVTVVIEGEDEEVVKSGVRC